MLEKEVLKKELYKTISAKKGPISRTELATKVCSFKYYCDFKKQIVNLIDEGLIEKSRIRKSATGRAGEYYDRKRRQKKTRRFEKV